MTLFIAGSSVLIQSCKKKTDDPEPTPTVTAPKSFLNLTFTTVNAYFSTNGTMAVPVDSNQAKTISSKIDFTFIYNNSYSEAGFMDPKTRSQHWYWDDYYKTWLSNSVSTVFYSTNLTQPQFTAAVSDQSLIGQYFADTAHVKIAPHDIFPVGTCIGGRQATNTLPIYEYQVWGFKNVSSGKRGLLYIQGQQSGWPWVYSATKVDILREN